jgi:hypothetical protein
MDRPETAPIPAVRDDVQAADPTQEAAPGRMESITGWISLYVPCWGTSFMMHVAIVMLMIFLAIPSKTVTPQEPYKFGNQVVVVPNVKNVQVRPKMQQVTQNVRDWKVPDQLKSGSDTGRGKSRPGPTADGPVLTDNPIIDWGNNRMKDRLAVLGSGGGGNQYGGYGMGTGSGRGRFMQTEAISDEAPHKIVYVVDRSGSMTDSLDFVKRELKRSIGTLSEADEFHVIFYSSGPPQEMPTRRLVAATDSNKKLAFEFIDNVVEGGETDPAKALERAFAVAPDLIYLLTDGEFDKGMIGFVKQHNPTGKAAVNTICFIYRDGEEVLKAIAAQNGGLYKFVQERDFGDME